MGTAWGFMESARVQEISQHRDLRQSGAWERGVREEGWGGEGSIMIAKTDNNMQFVRR